MLMVHFTVPFQVIGFSLLFAIVFLATLASLCDFQRCCRGRRITYDMVILEEGEKLLKGIIREAAKEELKKNLFEKIDGEQSEVENNWIKCFDVTAEMIQRSEKPNLSKTQKQEWNDLNQDPQQGLLITTSEVTPESPTESPTESPPGITEVSTPESPTGTIKISTSVDTVGYTRRFQAESTTGDTGTPLLNA